MVAVTLFQDGSYRIAKLHSLLCSLICSDAVAHQRNSQGHPVDNTLRTGKNLPIWWAYYSWS